jgi:uncharacterized membrane protein YesL
MKLEVTSPFIQAGMKMTNMLIVNVCWILGSLPIVTIGASTIAAHTVLIRMIEDRDDIGVFAAFWKAWVQNLRHGVAFTLVFAAALYSAWMSWQLFEKLPDNPIGFLILAIAIVFLMLVHFIYAFVLDARYENRIVQQLQNSRMISMKYWLRTLGLLGIVGAILAFFLLVNPFVTYMGLFICPVAVMYATTAMALPILHELEHDKYADDGLEIDAERDW